MAFLIETDLAMFHCFTDRGGGTVVDIVHDGRIVFSDYFGELRVAAHPDEALTCAGYPLMWWVGLVLADVRDAIS